MAVFELHEKGYDITKLCALASISRAGYYKWKDRIPSEAELENERLATEIKRIYEESNKIYGVERIKWALLRELNWVVNVKRIRRLMQIMGISSIIRRKKPQWVKSKSKHTAKNVIARNFDTDAPNKKWFTDVTYLPYGNGQKAYLSAIIDRYDQTIIAWKISTSNDNPLVMDTIDLAFNNNPGARPIIHSDRGSQYTSGQYQELKLAYKFRMSMSRVSKCLDNQPIESFFGILKSEYFYQNKFKTLEDLINGIGEYIDFYMNKRYVAKFNGLTPVEFRGGYLKTA